MLKKILHHNAQSCAKTCCTKIENFGVKIGGFTVFEGVNIHVHCGELTAVIGPNGAGKSTLLKAILGDIPHTGKLAYVDAKNKRTGHPVIGYVPQQLDIDKNSPVSVADIFAASLTNVPACFFIGKKMREKTKTALSRTEAAHLINRRVGALSGGELQRVLLALALEPLPDILLLDEPVSGIDQNGLAVFYGIVSHLREAEDMAIILVSHDLDMVKAYADKVVLLNKTVLASGPPEKVFAEIKSEHLF